MSFDLLAEFGEPQTKVAGVQPQRILSKTKPVSSDFDGFDFFASSSAAGGNEGVQSSNQKKDVWGNLGNISSALPKSNVTPATNVDPWGSLSSFGGPSQSKSIAPADWSTSNNRGFGTTSYQSNPQQGTNRVPTLDLISSSIADLAKSERAANPCSTSNAILNTSGVKSKANKDVNVLFDAEDEDSDEDEEDFGDFETVTEPESVHAVPQTISSQPPIITSTSSNPKRPHDLSLEKADLTSCNFPYPQAPNSPAYQERNPFQGIKITTPIATPTQEEPPALDQPITAWPTFELQSHEPLPYYDSPAKQNPKPNDDWGDFENLPAVPAVSQPAIPTKASPDSEADAWAWGTVNNVPTSKLDQTHLDNALPPTNVPPPSILLSIFQQLFDLPNSTLFKALGTQPFPLKNRVLSDPSTLIFLRAYLLLATVAAHIIGGRKQRWKRDHILAQSMSIGQASAGGKGGMKLTNVDKTETNRESREAAEVVRIWKDQVGRLRSMVSTANQSFHDPGSHLVIPDINEVLPLKTVSGAEGGVTAPKACIICGLKRDERILKVDIHVEDSFGEWWVDHWGHRSCKNFWQEHEAQLKSR